MTSKPMNTVAAAQQIDTSQDLESQDSILALFAERASLLGLSIEEALAKLEKGKIDKNPIWDDLSHLAILLS